MKPFGEEDSGRLAQTIELAKVGFYAYALDGTVRRMDANTLRFFDLEDRYPHPDAVIGENIGRLFQYCGPEGALRKILMERGKISGMEYQIRTLSGKLRWGIHNALLVTDPDGRGQLVQTCFFDITNQKMSEGALRESCRNYENLVATIPLGMVETDLLGTIQFCNERFRGIPDEGPPELKGHSILEVFSDPRMKEFLRGLLEEVRNGQEVAGCRMVQIRRKSGEQEFLQVDWNGKQDEQGSIIGVLLVVKDETESVRLTERLKVKQRMDALAILSSGFAHDFNNLLGNVLGHADLIKSSGDLNGPMRNHLDRIVAVVKTASSLVDHLDPDPARKTQDVKVFDLHGVVLQALQLPDQVGVRPVDHRVEFPPGKFFISGSETELSRVFLNLMQNAVQALEVGGLSGERRISVRAQSLVVGPPAGGPLETRAVGSAQSALSRGKGGPAGPGPGSSHGLKEGSYVHLRFEDTGCGMSAIVRENAFVPMFTTKERSSVRGRGLGLAIVYQLVTNRFGGEIDLESEEGRGSVFHLFLPIATRKDGQEQAAKNLGTGDGTVLVIDDEEQYLVMLRELVTVLGYSCLIASSGKQALKIFTERHREIDAVLLDLSMPEMPGEEVLKELRRIDPTVKVLISSGLPPAEIPPLGDTEGLLPKPFGLQELSAALKKLV